MINFFLKYKKLSLLLALVLILFMANYSGVISFSSTAVKIGWFTRGVFGWISYAGNYIYKLPQSYREDETAKINENRDALNRAYYQNVAEENERLREILKMPVRESLKPIGAKVLMSGITSHARTIFIDRGTSDGVKEGFPVVFEDKIVGKIKKASSYTSLVYLITHPDIAVDVTIAGKDVRGVFRGGIKPIVDYVDVETEVSQGDLLYSSGKGGVYPEGFKVGVIEKVGREKKSVFHSITASAIIIPKKLNYVFIVPPVGLDEMKEVLEEK